MENDQIKLQKREALLRGFFDVDLLTLQHVTTTGGWSETLERYVLHRPDAVCAIVHNTDSDVLYFVRQFRIAAAQKEGGWSIECAAGLVDKGETPYEAVRREVLEEIGFEVGRPEFLRSFFVSPAIISERIFLYYCPVTDADWRTAGGGLATEHEDIEILEVPVSDLTSFMVKNTSLDAKSIIGISMFQALSRTRK